MSLDDSETAQPGRGPEALPDIREITDVRTLRALAHPVRIALIEALIFSGAMTATEAGERIGETPTTCSFHLRQLARYGLVEEAGGGKGRARPWRVTSIGYSLNSVHDDPEAEIASNAVLRLWRERTLSRYQTWLETKATYPRRWREAASDNEYLLFLTAGELDQLNQELTDLLLPRYRERITDPSLRPPGAVPVELLTFSYPIDLPAAGEPADHGDEQ
jgi:DNA-binding transcriptional ArsR family regulator